MRRSMAALCAALLLGLCMADSGAASSDTPACDASGNRLDCGAFGGLIWVSGVAWQRFSRQAGYVGMSQQDCEQKGCCWQPAEFPGSPHVDLPWCFKPNGEASEYRVTDLQEGEGGSVRAQLEVSRRTQPYLGPDIEVIWDAHPRGYGYCKLLTRLGALTLDAEPLSGGVLRLKIGDAAGQRWEVPQWLLASELLPSSRGRKCKACASASGGGSGSGIQFQLSVKQEPFSLEVTRPGAGATLFNSTATRLVFKDQYLELSTWISPSAMLFGAGERASHTLHLERNGMPRALWNHDLGPTFPEQNMYSSHPFVLALQPDGSAWGMLLLSSNAMDIVPSADRLSWRVTGGILDLLVLGGPTPLAVLDQLTAVVGRPAMMPYWSLGWHQCKYGYRSVWEVEAVVANYSKAGLPLEAIWTDIDHMDGWRDFTFHPQNFPLPEMQRFVEELHYKGQRWMPIVDPGIKVDPGYPAYDQGLKEDAFMRGVNGHPYLGWVWPGGCHFPDFLSPNGRDFFTSQLERHYGMVPWDGIWIDMNEASNFCTGDVCQPRAHPPGQQLGDDPPWVCQLDCHEAQGLNASQRAWLHPPYDISSSLQRLPLGTKAMSVLASHHDGSVQYNTHQLYGLSAVLTISRAVQGVLGRRPFVLSRSSFLGLGSYAAHWTGDNSATWQQLRWSIPGVLSIGLWGIPMAGADICGFMGDTTPELCARWAALGAFYPFSRAHSDLHGGYQELYRWPEVAAAGKKALGMRYRLLPYLYSAFHAAHQNGAPVMRPLFLTFPGDPNTHNIDRQFMVGDALLVSPVLEQGATSVEAYFPPGTWHSLWGSGEVVATGEGGKTVRLDAPLDTIPLHMRGGSALVMQCEGLTTREVKRSPLTVVVALPGVLKEGGAALGPATNARITAHVYNDGGEEPEVGESLCNFLHIDVAIRPQPAGRGHTAEVLLQFGSPEQLRRGGSGDGVCGPVSDVEQAAAAGGGMEWPELGGIDVLGWHLPVEGATVEVVQRIDSCGELAVVEHRHLSLPDGMVGAGPGGLRLDLSTLRHKLECPYGLHISWSSVGFIGTA